MGRPEQESSRREFSPKNITRGEGEPPLHEQIKEDLVASVEAGVFLPRTSLPTEKQLTVGYGVGRDTVRRALGGMVKDGYLKVTQGISTGGYLVVEPSQREQQKREAAAAKPEHRNKPHHVAGELLGRILEGQYQANKRRLPPEKELIEEFGYSRNTIRTGLKLLKDKRVVNITQGGGTFVVKILPPREDLEKLLDTFGREAPETKEPAQKKGVVYDREKTLVTEFLTQRQNLPELQEKIEALSIDERTKLNGELLKTLANDQVDNYPQKQENAYRILLVSGLDQMEPRALRSIYNDAIKSIPAEGNPNALLDLGLAMSHLLPPHRDTVTTIHRSLKTAQRRARNTWEDGIITKSNQLEQTLVKQYMSTPEFTRELGAIRFNEVTTMIDILGEDAEQEREIIALKNLQKMRALDGIEENSSLSKVDLFKILQIKNVTYNNILIGRKTLSKQQKERLVERITQPQEHVILAESTLMTELEDKQPTDRITGYGKHLQSLTENSGLTQKDIAEIVGKSPFMVNYLMNNKTDIEVQDARVILMEVEERAALRDKALALLQDATPSSQSEQKKALEHPLPHKIDATGLSPIERLVALRRHYRINQNDLCEHTSFENQMAVSRVESGKRKLHGDDFNQLLNALQTLGVPLAVMQEYFPDHFPTTE